MKPLVVIKIWKLDRLGRTTKQLIELSHDLKERGVSLQINHPGSRYKHTSG
ncbi:recombinase family protein [Paenibacillus sp. PL91]|uniref:recombinase family protein n=1 Tax=Paenibacillus sp. PL91 TaxID=2729538 RepID=UPI003983D1B8